jgi:hypothetical protein
MHECRLIYAWMSVQLCVNVITFICECQLIYVWMSVNLFLSVHVFVNVGTFMSECQYIYSWMTVNLCFYIGPITVEYINVINKMEWLYSK